MAFPIWKSRGTATHASTATTVPLPSSWAAGDLILLFIETDADDTASVSSGWTAVTGSPVSTTSSATDAKLYVWYRRAVGGDTAPTVTPSSTHFSGCTHAFSGVKTTGDPFTDTTTGALNSTSTSVTVPGATVNSEHHLLVVGIAVGWDANNAGFFNLDHANSDVPALAWRSGETTNLNSGGGVGVYVGGLSINTGTCADTTLTVDGATYQAYMSIALAPAVLEKESSDTGSGADNQTAPPATLSENDPSSAAAEASTIAATLPVSNDASSAAAEASSITSTVPTENDPSNAATEASSISASFTATETGSGVDAESLVVNLSDGDTGVGAESSSIEGMDADVADADTGSGAEDSTIVVSLSDDDTGTGVEDSSIVASFTDADTGSGLDDNNAIDQVLSDGDTGSAVDDGVVTSVLLTDADTGTGVDAGSAPSATLSDAETGSLGDSESVNTGAPVVPRNISVSFGGRRTGVEEVARTNIPWCIAHRGGPDDYGPENLLSTCAAAVAEGASIEVDVRNSVEDTPWIMHDWDVDRTTNGTGGVINLTDSYLNGLIADGTGGLEGIPTLLEVLNMTAAANSFSKVIIHYNAGGYTQASIEAIQADIDASGMNDRVIFMSWLWEHLRDFQLWGNPDIERMQILTTDEPWYPSIYQTSILVGDYTDLTLQAVQEAQASGLVVHGSTGGDAGFRKLMTTGVASEMTDSPNAYWKWLGQYSTGSV